MSPSNVTTIPGTAPIAGDPLDLAGFWHTSPGLASTLIFLIVYVLFRRRIRRWIRIARIQIFGPRRPRWYD